MKRGEITEHPEREFRLRPGLRLDVNQKKRISSQKTGFHQQVDLVPLTGSEVTEHFLIKKLDCAWIEIRRDFREEEFNELDEERSEKFLK